MSFPSAFAELSPDGFAFIPASLGYFGIVLMVLSLPARRCSLFFFQLTHPQFFSFPSFSCLYGLLLLLLSNILSLVILFYLFIFSLSFRLCVCLYTVCAWSLQRPEDGIRSLGLALQMVVSYHVAAGN